MNEKVVSLVSELSKSGISAIVIVLDGKNSLETSKSPDVTNVSPVTLKPTFDNIKRQRIKDLKAAGMNQTQIILAVWGAKKGGTKRYQQALAEYKQLTGE